jgi:hypothetical protein
VDPNVVNTVTVLVTSTGDPTGIPVTLTETGPNTGVFTGSFELTSGPSATNSLHVESGNTIKATYNSSVPHFTETINGVTTPGSVNVQSVVLPDSGPTSPCSAGPGSCIFSPVGNAVDVSFVDAQADPNAIGTVTMSYANTNLGINDPNSLLIYQFTPNNGWQPLDGCSANTGSSTISCQTSAAGGIPLGQSGMFVIGTNPGGGGAGGGGIAGSSGDLVLDFSAPVSSGTGGGGTPGTGGGGTPAGGTVGGTPGTGVGTASAPTSTTTTTTTPTSTSTSSTSGPTTVVTGSPVTNATNATKTNASAIITPPMTLNLTAITSPSKAVDIKLEGSDPHKGSPTYSVTSQPSHGVLSGILYGATGPVIHYIPSQAYTDGIDIFKYKATDSTGSLINLGTVTIKVVKSPASLPTAAPILGPVTWALLR